MYACTHVYTNVGVSKEADFNSESSLSPEASLRPFGGAGFPKNQAPISSPPTSRRHSPHGRVLLYVGSLP